MQSAREQGTKSGNFLRILELFNAAFPRHRKIHDYTGYEMGVDYLLEFINQGSKGYMTGQGKGIRRGDYLLLQCERTYIQYQIEDIDYYSNPSNMWIALLIKVE